MRELEAEAAEATAQYHKVGDTVYSLQDRCTELEQAKAALTKQANATEAMLSDEIAKLKAELGAANADNAALSEVTNLTATLPGGGPAYFSHSST